MTFFAKRLPAPGAFRHSRYKYADGVIRKSRRKNGSFRLLFYFFLFIFRYF